MNLVARIWLGLLVALAVIGATVATNGLLPIVLGICLLSIWSYGQWINS